MYRLICLIIALFTTPLLATSQSVSGGVLCKYVGNISTRWSYGVGAHLHYAKMTNNIVWGGSLLEGRFVVTDSVALYVKANHLCGLFYDTDNRDIAMTLTEGINFSAKHGMSHDVICEQMRLYYKPSGYENTCTRLTYIFGKHFQPWKKDVNGNYWQLRCKAHLVANLRSDISGTGIFQRFKTDISIVRRLYNGKEIGLNYIYMLGGKRQSYVGEGHNLHRIVLFFEF